MYHHYADLNYPLDVLPEVLGRSPLHHGQTVKFGEV